MRITRQSSELLIFLGLLVSGALGQQIPANRPDLVIDQGHQANIRSLAFSPDGRLIVSGSDDNTIAIWDLESGRRIRTLLRPGLGAILDLVFSADGRNLISGSADGTVTEWDLQNGRNRVLWKSPAEVVSVDLSRDGKYVAAGSFNGVETYVAILDRGVPEKFHLFKDRPARFLRSRTALSPDERYVISTASDGPTAFVWDRHGGNDSPVGRHQAFGDQITGVRFSPRGDVFVTADSAGTAILWKVGSEMPVHQFENHADGLVTAQFDGAGGRLITAGKDGKVKVWDTASRQLVQVFEHNRPIQAATIARDGRRLGVAVAPTAPNELGVIIYDMATAKPLLRLGSNFAYIDAASFNENASIAVTAGADGSQRIWQLPDMSSSEMVPSNASRKPRMVALDPTGRNIALAVPNADRHSQVLVLEKSTGKLAGQLYAHVGPLRCVCMSDDGSSSIVAGEKTAFWIHLPDCRRLAEPFTPMDARIDNVAFWKGQPIAFVTSDDPPRLSVRHIDSGLTVKDFHMDFKEPINVQFDRRTGRIVMAGSDGSIHLCSLDGNAVSTLQPRRASVTAVALSRSNDTAVVAYADGYEVWLDLAQGGVVGTTSVIATRGETIRKNESVYVHKVAFSKDARRLAVVWTNGTLAQYDTLSGRLLSTLATRDAPDHIALDKDGSKAVIWGMSPARSFYSESGKTEISGGKSPVMLETSNWKTIRAFEEPGLRDEIAGASFSDDETMVVAYYSTGRVIWWNTSTGRITQRLQLLEGGGHHPLALGSDGGSIAYQIGGRIKVFSLLTQKRADFPWKENLEAVAFGANENFLATAGVQIRVLDIVHERAKSERSLSDLLPKVQFPTVKAIAVGKDLTRIICDDSVGNKCHILSLGDKVDIWSIERVGEGISRADFTGDGTALAVSYFDGSLDLLNVTERCPISRIIEPSKASVKGQFGVSSDPMDFMSHIRVGPDDHCLAVTSRTKVIEFWPQGGKPAKEWPSIPGHFPSCGIFGGRTDEVITAGAGDPLIVSQSRKRVVWGTPPPNPEIKGMPLLYGDRLSWQFVGGNDPVGFSMHGLFDLDTTPAARWVVAVGGATADVTGDEVEVRSIADGSLVFAFHDHLFPVSFLTFSQDGKYLLSSGLDRRSFLYTLTPRDVSARELVLEGTVSSGLLISRDDRSPVALMVTDDGVILWPADENRPRKLNSEVSYYSSPVIAVDQTTHRIAVGGGIQFNRGAHGESGVVRAHLDLFSDDGVERLVSKDYSYGRISAIGFNNDSRSLFAGTYGGEVFQVDTKDLAVLADFGGHPAAVRGLWLDRPNNFLITSSRDNTIRWWNIDDHSPIAMLAFFEDQRNWIVSSPDGRFDTPRLDAPSGLSWVFSANPFRPLPAEVFQRDFYEPQLLGKLLNLDEIQRLKAQTLPSLGTLNTVQPLVGDGGHLEVNAIPDRTGWARVIVRVAGRREASPFLDGDKIMEAGAFDLRVFRDGQLVGQMPAATASSPRPAGGISPNLREDYQKQQSAVCGAGQIAQYALEVRLPQHLAGMPIEFTAYAFNNDRVRSSIARSNFTVPPNAGTSSSVARHAYIITFGASAFENPSWNLNYADDDAREVGEAFGASLEAAGEFDRPVIVPLISDHRGVPGTLKFAVTERGATRKRLEVVLGLLAGHPSSILDADTIAGLPVPLESLPAATPDDLVLLLISSHGYTAPDGTFYFLPYDIGADAPGRREMGDAAKRDDLLKRCISSDDLSRWLREIDTGELVLLIDTCQSAGAVAPPGYKHGPFGSRGLGQLAYDKGMRVLAASQFDREDYEPPPLGHGLLVHALVEEGLRSGRAAEGSDGGLTLRRLLAFAGRRLPGLQEEWKAGKLSVGGRPVIPKLTEADKAELRGIRHPVLFDFARQVRDVKLATPPRADHAPD